MNNIRELPKILNDLDTPFKISAGPGAGKTTWLVEHVQNVIRNSNKLDKTKRVACITYTRIGAEKVEQKVKKLTDTSRLDIGTIHSFLYRNIVKPFSYLIEKDLNGNDLFNISEINGHVEHRPSYDRISSWINRIGIRYNYLTEQKTTDKDPLSNFDKTRILLNSFEWSFLGEKLEGKLSKPNITKLKFPSTKLYEYKLACWSKGVMHHEDVLYFTHFIFNKSPRVIEFVSNKFPYLFLDEFQDTNPLQTWIIKEISKQSTVIGVIGDPAQSIFKFAGASRKDFNEFSLPNINEFKKTHNFRSSLQIISFLRHLRCDIEQTPKKDAIKGDKVVVFVGDENTAIKHLKNLGDDNFSVLCRWNKDVNHLHDISKDKSIDLINLLYSDDSNHKRPRFIHALAKAHDFNMNGEYKSAIKELKKVLPSINLSGIEKRKLLIQTLEYLKCNQHSIIVDIYMHLQSILKKHSVTLTGLRKTKGDYKGIHKAKFIELIPFLTKQTNISDKIRTIHQAKGDEFNNVLLCLFNKTDKNGKVTKKIETILNDYIFESKINITLDSDIGEETRLVYVACSRARNNLFISVPTLSYRDELKLQELGVSVDRMTS